MKPGYEIHVLSNEEYDLLPYEYAKESQGMTIPKKNVSYVRSSGNKDVDRFFINHEFDEIMQANSDHEIDGVRYGFWSFVKNIFKTILPKLLFGIGAPLATSAINAIGGGSRQSSQIGASPPQPSQFTPSAATSAFAPTSQNPLSTEDYNKSIQNITSNTQQQTSDVFSRFRGLGSPTQNSALFGALGNVKSSGQRTLDQFKEDQNKLSLA